VLRECDIEQESGSPLSAMGKVNSHLMIRTNRGDTTGQIKGQVLGDMKNGRIGALCPGDELVF